VGVQGAKPPEADEFLHVKGIFSLIQDNERNKKMGKKKFKRGGGGGELYPPLDAMKETKAVYVVIQNKRNVGIV
jgi:hypothetical protein